MEHLSTMGIPGCDCLWSDMDVLRYSTACKLASSAAHLASKKDVMIEASNMVDKDQNITLEKAKAAISVMFVHGITHITSYYGERMLPDDELKAFNSHVSSLTQLFRNGKYRINTLLYYPFENLCADCGPQGVVEGNDNGEDHLRISSTSAALMKRQVCFDFINKKMLLACELCDGYLRTPSGERVEYLVFPDIPWLDAEVATFVGEAQKCGVEVILDGPKRQIGNASFAAKFMCDGAYPSSELSLTEEDQYIAIMERTFDGYDLFMVMNTDTVSHKVKMRIKSADVCGLSLVDHLTKVRTPIELSVFGNDGCLSFDISALDFIIIERASES